MPLRERERGWRQIGLPVRRGELARRARRKTWRSGSCQTRRTTVATMAAAAAILRAIMLEEEAVVVVVVVGFVRYLVCCPSLCVRRRPFAVGLC